MLGYYYSYHHLPAFLGKGVQGSFLPFQSAKGAFSHNDREDVKVKKKKVAQSANDFSPRVYAVVRRQTDVDASHALQLKYNH